MHRKDFLRCLGLSAGALLFKGCLSAEENPTQNDKPKKESIKASYLLPDRKKILKQRVEKAYSMLEKCNFCPRKCQINRRKGEEGFCQAPERAVVHSHSPHFGEELPLVGKGGSGTIFFSNCNLRCVFCQNYPIAHQGRGRQVSDEVLADMMLDLQRRGCHNINVVTPTHVVPNILSAILIASEKGLTLPICYNTSGYETVEVIKLLDGIVDIYLPDMKFMDSKPSEKYAMAPAGDYPEMAKNAIIEMHRQTGDLVTDDAGVAIKGVMIRHLVMPNGVSGTEKFVKWVAQNLSKNTYVNIMAQYRVEYKAFQYPKIARAITNEEFLEAIAFAKKEGLTNIDNRSLSRAAMMRNRLF